MPLVAGKPLWAANKKHTAQENADYQFAKNGKDFDAKTETDYIDEAHAFADAPPVGVQKIERSNGDALLYDAKSNTFAVVAKTGRAAEPCSSRATGWPTGNSSNSARRNAPAATATTPTAEAVSPVSSRR